MPCTADRAYPLKNDPRHVSPHCHREIFALQRRTQISRRGAFAPAVADGHLHSGEAILPLAVIVVIEFVARAGGGFQIRIDERILIARFARSHRSVAPAIVARAAFPAFLAAEIGQHVIVRPPAQAVRGPAGVVAAVAAHMSHGIDGRRPANDFAARAFDAAPGHRSLRLAVITPVVNAVEQHLAPTERQLDIRVPVPAARFEQQHARVGVGRESICESAIGRACPNNNIIETGDLICRHVSSLAVVRRPYRKSLPRWPP
jgi:hypothetical protein